MAGNVHQDDPDKLRNSAIVECKKINIDRCNAVTGWAAAGQASNLTASTTHVEGTHSLEFDKSGEEGTEGYIEKTITSVNIGDFQTHAIGHTKVYLSDVSQVSKVFLRLGTDSSNYFQYDFTILEDGWNDLDFMLSHRTSQAGVGADLSDVTYVAAGVVMNANGNTLTGILIDSIHVKRMLEALSFGAPSIELASRIRLQDNNTGRMLEVNAAHEGLVHDGDVGTLLTAIKSTDGIKKITDDVNVTQAAKDRTITGTATVTQAEKDRTVTGTVTTKKGDTDYTKVKKTGFYTTQQTDTTLWDPTAGKKFVITDIIVSVDTEMEVHLEDGTTKIWDWHFAANGGAVINLQTPDESATADNNLTITMSAAGKCSIKVLGYEV